MAGGLCAKCLWEVSFGADPPEDVAGEDEQASAWARLGDYDLYDEIAHGGMGRVLAAIDLNPGSTPVFEHALLEGFPLYRGESR